MRLFFTFLYYGKSVLESAIQYISLNYCSLQSVESSNPSYILYQILKTPVKKTHKKHTNIITYHNSLINPRIGGESQTILNYTEVIYYCSVI